MRVALLILFSLSVSCVGAQYKIAVFNPTSNTTKICSTFDSAYNLAQAGDHIYLPAGSFPVSQPVSKRLSIYGTGINPDSSLMGITIISSSNFFFDNGCDGLLLEGIKLQGSLILGNGPSSPTNQSVKVHDVTFKRCEIRGSIVLNNPVALEEQYKPRNIQFVECIINNVNGNNNTVNWIFVKCLISGNVNSIVNSAFLNNVFTFYSPFFDSPFSVIQNCTFSNNIFQKGTTNTGSQNSIFYNNINCTPNIDLNNVVSSIAVAPDQIFIDISNPLWYKNNYQLKPGGAGIAAGTDGTDVGIYGTSQPTKPGWIPSNPHVYFKNVAAQNNASGILNATFKVKAQSN